MKSKFTLVALAIFIAVGVCVAYLNEPKVSTPAPVQSVPESPATQTPARPAFRITPESHAGDLAAELLRTTAADKPILGPKKREMQTARGSARVARQKPPVQAPEARFALSYVGADELAEEIWSAAINDLSIPPNERQDLIEDLNEDGFPDPHNITIDDLPLILSRLALIEQFAPDALDDVNAEAFAEAYKDLVKMVGSLTEE
jgi:hypothetical protein